MRLKAGLTVFLIALAAMSGLAAAPSANAPLDDGVDRTDPNFVKASLLITQPGGALFSCVGHSCIRLECPAFKLDYCFSYESEDVESRIFTFFTGRLKMGMFAVETPVYLSNREQVTRGVMQYPLELPSDVKQKLWKLLDEKVAEGFTLPYDYVERGCAHAILKILRDAVDPMRFFIPPWTSEFRLTRREIVAREVSGPYPWNAFFLHAIWGSETDRDVSNINKILTPTELLSFLRRARIDGREIVTDGTLLVPIPDRREARFVISPFVFAWLFFTVVLVNLLVHSVWADKILVLIEFFAGIFFAYLVCISSLPASSWNWLIVPFNPLPLVFWRWRRWWAWPFVAVLMTWEAFMLLSPHQLTDPAYLVIVLAYVAFYAKIGLRCYGAGDSVCKVTR